jgi:hypothetical protein
LKVSTRSRAATVAGIMEYSIAAEVAIPSSTVMNQGPEESSQTLPQHICQPSFLEFNAASTVLRNDFCFSNSMSPA